MTVEGGGLHKQILIGFSLCEQIHKSEDNTCSSKESPPKPAHLNFHPSLFSISDGLKHIISDMNEKFGGGEVKNNNRPENNWALRHMQQNIMQMSTRFTYDAY